MAFFLTSINDALENTLANSAQFQAWTGAADATAAKAFIFNFDQTSNPPTKFCNIRDMSDWSYTRDGSGSDAGGASFNTKNIVDIYFLEEVDDWDETNARAFLDAMGGIVFDVLNSGGTYNLRPASITKKPYDDIFRLRAEQDDSKAYQYMWTVTHRV